MRQFKTILAASFIIFLFLPLSQCSLSNSKPIEEGKTNQIDKVDIAPDKFIPVEEFEDDIGAGLLVLITFLMPLITSVLRPRRWIFVITNNIVQILSTVWLGYVVFFWTYGFNSPLLSGHILFFLVCVFLVSSLYTTVHSFKKLNNKVNDNVKKEI